MPGEYTSLLVFVAFAALFAVAGVAVSGLLGPRHPSPTKSQPYECGIVPSESARQRLPIGFYLTAMLFIVFDVEAIFVYPWAVLLRQLGAYGLLEMGGFLGILAVALVYVWRKGALEWE